MTTPININHFTFKVTNGQIETTVPKTTPELWPIADTFNEIGIDEDLWHDVCDTLDGKRPFPYWTGGDSMEIKIEEDGTWFREQEEWRHSDGIKIANKDAKELIRRAIEARKHPTTTV